MSKPVPDAKAAAPTFFTISPLMIFPETLGRFSIYLRQGDEYVLYADSEERFSERHRRNLHESGVKEVFVKTEQKEHFERYVESNLGRILADEALPMSERARVFMDAAKSVVEEVFEERLPAIRLENFNRLKNVVEQSIRFLTKEKALTALAPFIAHDYKGYTHSIHVFVFTLAVLQSFGAVEEELFQAGMGAMLHDVGKLRVPKEILNKRTLNRAEQEVLRGHPLWGVSLCAQLTMSQTSLNCILFHHERMDGEGYPGRLPGEGIPFPVRVLSVCDAYDNLTSERPGSSALSPFEALRAMRDDMKGAFDLEVFKRFVQVLSGASLV
ncbi:HD domain-containing phosphohydrolase [Desulfovibrio aminophilus]|uniref:HD-GYP domain-containing protein n=1 Tax=Desulfovibrio aminophilus TaxID=81425 RepID=UPI0033936419